MSKKKVSLIFGTRPEALKLIPVIREFKKIDLIDTKICITGQHREMLAQVLRLFGVIPDEDLNLMSRNQDLPTLTARLMKALDRYLQKEKPELIIVQGDTTSAFLAALAAFYHHIPVGHVEAGLRSNDKYSPFPEEINRIFVSSLADIHFAPTDWAKNNLLHEGISASRVFITGNPIVDMIHLALEFIGATSPASIRGIPENILLGKQDVVLITGHRRESFGQGFKDICRGIKLLARDFRDTVFIYPVHLNPNVERPVHKLLGNIPNVYLLKPIGYLDFIRLMKRSLLILTDSGGIQEEAPTLKKPVLIMRERTERPEALRSGTAKLVGTSASSIYRETKRLLLNKKLYAQMIKTSNPFGDGKAAERIVHICPRFVS
jgi:UDP-N-acetylglucosamine 2-epimerase (non-hydrolysing)